MSSAQGSTWVSASVKNKDDLTATVSVKGAFSLGNWYQWSATTNLYVDGVYLTSGTSGSGSSYTDIGKASGTKDLPRKASAYSVKVKAYSYGASGQYYGGITGDSTATTTVTIPAYPIYKPDAPTNGKATRNSDSEVSLSWTNNTSTTKPYNSIKVQRSVNGGNWSDLATLGGDATTYTDKTTSAGSYYSYRVYATNSTDSSDTLTLGTAYMTPSAPTNLSWERVEDTTVKLTMTNTTTTATGLEVQKRASSADEWETVATVSGKVTETSVNIGGGEFYVRVRNTRGSMYSPWTQTADKVVTITPPNPPTLIAPASSMVVSKADGSIRFEWTHNPIDGTPQTAANVTWRKQGTTTDNVITVGADSYATLDLASIEPETIIEWYVQTKGAHADFSGQSATWTFDVEQVPTIQVTAPTGTVASTPIEYGFIYDDTPSKALASHTVEITDQSGAVVYRKDGGTEYGGTIPREDFLPTNGETYTVTIRATSTSTLSNSANNTFHVEYDLPVGASIETQADAESGAVTVIVDTLEQEYVYKSIETNTDTKITISEKQETRNLFGDIRSFTVDRTTYGRVDNIEVGTEPDWGEYVFLVGKEMRVGAIPEDFISGYGFPEPMQLSEDLREYAMPAEGGKNYVLSFNASPGSSSDVGVANFSVVFYDEEYKTIPVQNGTWHGGGIDGQEVPFYDHANNLGTLQYRYETGDNINLATSKPSPQGARYATLCIEFASDVNVYMSHFQFEQGVTSTDYVEHIVEVDTEIRPKDNVSGLTVYGKSVQGENPSPDNPQEVYSVEGILDVTSRGKNLLDIDSVGYTAKKYVRTTDGALVTSTKETTYASGYMDVRLLAGKAVTLTSGVSVSGSATGAAFFDAGKAYLSGFPYPKSDTTQNVEIDIPDNAVYMLFTFNVDDASDIKVQIEQGTQATQYEPYTESRTQIDLQGNVIASLPDGTCDELTVDASGHVRLVKRVGVVDLGTLSYTKSSSIGNSFFCPIPDAKTFKSWVVANAICSAYKVARYDDLATYEPRISARTNDNTGYQIRDSRYSEVSEFVPAMSGVKLYYELAEPQTIELGNIGKIGLVRPETYMNVNTSINTNAIVTISRGGIDAVGYDIQRISDNGTVTILANADGHTAYQDRYAPANVDYTYRVVTYADSGAFEVSEEGARLDTPYWYLLTDTETAKAKYNPQASESIACADSNLVRYAGRRYPVLYEADAIEDTYEASGVVIGKDSIEPFRTIQRGGGKAAYKSNDGDVINVHCSTSLTRGMTIPPTYEVSVSMERIDGGAL